MVADVIRIAKGEIGYRESGTNNTKYNHWLGQIPGYPHNGYGYPWCASWASWVFDKAGLEANVDYPKTAGCEVAVAWYKSHDRWGSTPKVGAQVFYGPRGGTHTEIVIGVSSGYITTIGGNTSGSLGGAYYNGDGVYQKSVARNESRIYGYGYPNYEEEDDMKVTDSVPVGKTYDKDFYHDSYPASYLWVMASAEAKKARIASEANAAVIKELSKTVASLAANGGDVNVDDLVSRIKTEIEKVSVRLEVAE